MSGEIQEKKCPDCGGELDVALFMEVEPDFYVCVNPECRGAFDLITLERLATIY